MLNTAYSGMGCITVGISPHFYFIFLFFYFFIFLLYNIFFIVFILFKYVYCKVKTYEKPGRGRRTFVPGEHNEPKMKSNTPEAPAPITMESALY